MTRYNVAMTFGPLVDVDTLARHLGRADWIVVDCRFTLTDPPAGAPRTIAAIFPARVMRTSTTTSRTHPSAAEGRHPLPDPRAVRGDARQLGHRPRLHRRCLRRSERRHRGALWWLLRWLGHRRCAVLDGGFAAWQDAGRPLEQAATELRAAALRASAADARTMSSRPRSSRRAKPRAICSSTPAPHRAIEASRNRSIRKAGHVPGACNRPFSANVTSAGRFRPPAELRPELLGAARRPGARAD